MPRAPGRARKGRGAAGFGLVLAIVLLVCPTGPALSQEGGEGPRKLNGFLLQPASVPLEEILPGGPPRDGIPALVDPEVEGAAEAGWRDDEPVLGVTIGKEARAYPLSVLEWHELVNDELGGRPILVSYCPLCGTGLVFDRRIGGADHTFGVSGLLYRSDLLLYDRASESLWSQISARAIAGPRTGERLRVVRSELTRFGDWRGRHPETTVLTPETGHSRPYGRSPYAGYEQSETVYFPVEIDERYHPKMPTLGIRVPDGPGRAYPAAEIVRAGGLVEETFEGRNVSIRYDPDEQVFRVEAPDDLEVVEGYWFAWAAFHPSTTVFIAADGVGKPRETDR